MISYNYYTKTLVILVVVFVILKYVIKVHLYDAILLSCIILTSYLIIEKVLSLNNTASKPSNCDKCTVPIKKENFKAYNENDDMNPLMSTSIPMAPTSMPMAPTSMPTAPTSNASNAPTSMPMAPTSEPIAPTSEPIANPIQYYMQPTDSPLNLSQQQSQEPPMDLFPDPTLNIPMIDTNLFKQPDMSEQISKNMPMIVDLLKSMPQFSKYSNVLSLLQTPELLMTNPQVMEFIQLLQNSFKSPQSLMENPKIMDGLNMLQQQQQQQQKQQQQQQQQQQQVYNSQDVNLYRLSEGDKRLTEQYIRDGNKYYNSIYTRSNPEDQKFDMASELKYGDLNYLAPLNKGMSNKDYTFISPNNWFPIPAIPPVCVTNKNCTTCPIIMSDGKDYMAWSDINDFDKSRRFTGNMGINIDYVKNVLNDSNGY